MTTLRQPLRFGLVGTGHWAQITHAPALASAEGIEFAAVWGRSPDAAGALAASTRPPPTATSTRFSRTSTRSRSRCHRMCRSRSPSGRPAPARPAAGKAHRHLRCRCRAAGRDGPACPGRVGRLLHGAIPCGRPGLAGRRHEPGRLGRWLCDLARIVCAGVQSLQHPLATGQGRFVGSGPARRFAAVGRSGPGNLRDRRRWPRGPYASGPASRERGDQRRDGDAECA